MKIFVHAQQLKPFFRSLCVVSLWEFFDEKLEGIDFEFEGKNGGF
jgi:hypothetical protein